MADQISDERRARQDAAMLSGSVAGAIVLALWCGGAFLAMAFGLGAFTTFLINPWFLLPVVAVAGGVVYWRTTRKNAAGGIPRREGSNER